LLPAASQLDQLNALAAVARKLRTPMYFAICAQPTVARSFIVR
jgi:hypothetical protein